MRYRLFFEPMDIEADDPDQAMDMYHVMDYELTKIAKVLPLDKDGFPIRLGGEVNEK